MKGEPTYHPIDSIACKCGREKVLNILNDPEVAEYLDFVLSSMQRETYSSNPPVSAPTQFSVPPLPQFLDAVQPGPLPFPAHAPQLCHSPDCSQYPSGTALLPQLPSPAPDVLPYSYEASQLSSSPHLISASLDSLPLTQPPNPEVQCAPSKQLPHNVPDSVVLNSTSLIAPDFLNMCGVLDAWRPRDRPDDETIVCESPNSDLGVSPTIGYDYSSRQPIAESIPNGGRDSCGPLYCNTSHLQSGQGVDPSHLQSGQCVDPQLSNSLPSVTPPASLRYSHSSYPSIGGMAKYSKDYDERVNCSIDDSNGANSMKHYLRGQPSEMGLFGALPNKMHGQQPRNCPPPSWPDHRVQDAGRACKERPSSLSKALQNPAKLKSTAPAASALRVNEERNPSIADGPGHLLQGHHTPTTGLAHVKRPQQQRSLGYRKALSQHSMADTTESTRLFEPEKVTSGTTTAAEKKLFFKIKICPWFHEGKCNYGDECCFAHHHNELRPAPNLMRMRMCPSLVKRGACSNLRECNYAHNKEELQKTPLYKTELCRHHQGGSCAAGELCRYAHGSADLRKPANVGALSPNDILRPASGRKKANGKSKHVSAETSQDPLGSAKILGPQITMGHGDSELLSHSYPGCAPTTVDERFCWARFNSCDWPAVS